MRDVDVADSIADLPSHVFDVLDRSAGAAGSHRRILQLEGDRRWRVRYARAWRAGRLEAMVPLITCRGQSWVDPAYDPGSWGLPGGPFGHAPDDVMLVGGCADLRSGLHVDSAATPERLSALLEGIAGLALSEDRILAFPYVYDRARRMISEATGGRTSWTHLGNEAVFADTHLPDREEGLGSRVRGVLQRDRRKIAGYAFRKGASRWTETADQALELIATHNIAKGKTDHPEFVRMRHDQWNRCEDVEVVAFTVESDALRGVLTALVWAGELELYEIGLTGQDGPERMAAYADLMFHQPMAFAAERGLRSVRAGLGAETPKSSRGATLRELSGGVLIQDERRMQPVVLPAKSDGAHLH